MVAQFLFFLLAAVAIVASFGVIISRNPVASALWLVLVLICVAGLYLTLNAEFIGVIQVLVYAGAIMVLFLFVIMLLNLGSLPRLQSINWRMAAAFFVGVAVLAQLMYVLASSFGILPDPIITEAAAETGSATALGLELFTRYALPLQVIGVLLLAATIGAVMLAKRRFV